MFRRRVLTLSLLLALVASLTGTSAVNAVLGQTSANSSRQISGRIVSFTKSTRKLVVRRSNGTVWRGRVAAGAKITFASGRRATVRNLKAGRKIAALKRKVSTRVATRINLGAATPPEGGYRVNVGGPALATPPAWTADTKRGPFKPLTGAAQVWTASSVDTSHSSVPSGTPAEVFNTGRSMRAKDTAVSLSLPVVAGPQTVRLYLVEPLATAAAGSRVFDVSVEGGLLLDNVDLAAEVGPKVAVVKTLEVTSDATLNLTVNRVVGAPVLSGIEVFPTPAPEPEPEPSPEPSPSPSPGPDPEPIPCTGTVLQPGVDIQAAIDAHPENTTFCLKAGTYRPAAQLWAKSGDQFIGEPGTVLNGARVITGWTKSGDVWWAPGPTVAPAQDGVTLPGKEGAMYPDTVFFDNQPLARVLSLSAMGPGKVFIDYPAGKIYVGDDPSGHSVERAAVEKAFKGLQTAIARVVIRGLIVEKFANPVQWAAVEAREDWVIENNEVRLNHGAGISAGPRTVVRNNYVHHNGQLGVMSKGGADIVFEGNEISYNNTLGFSPSWEAGGSKFLYTTNLVVRNNWVHHNEGPGLWTDVNNIYTLYEGNVVEYNSYSGIFHEVSYAATIRNNVSRGNGFGSTWRGDGAGIMSASSPNVEIYGNTVELNKNGIILYMVDRSGDVQTAGPHETANSYVHDNQITMSTGTTGLIQTVSDNSYFTARNNRFEDNTYFLGTPGAPRFEWMNSIITRTPWQAYGQDVNGTFDQP